MLRTEVITLLKIFLRATILFVKSHKTPKAACGYKCLRMDVIASRFLTTEKADRTISGINSSGMKSQPFRFRDLNLIKAKKGSPVGRPFLTKMEKDNLMKVRRGRERSMTA